MSATTTRPTTTSTTTPATRTRPQAAVLGAVRIVVSFLFLSHGLQGLFGAFGGIDGDGAAVPALAWPSWWASVICLVGGALVFTGLLTRPAALVCSGAMAYAYFTVHLPLALFPLENQGEQAALFSWVFLLIAVSGPGSWALDNLRRA